MEHTTYDHNEYAALVLRVALGGMYLSHGLIKLFVFTLAGTVGFFESIGYPGFFAYVVTFAEIGGGLLLIAGVYTRWVAIALVPILLGAMQFHFGNGFLFSVQGGGWEYPLFLMILSGVVALMGDGAYALLSMIHHTDDHHPGLGAAH
ncbi:MAG: DoxX family protein [Magnetovibrio sp.]|nr:DoxX family protein [Magnetovibrio sp.]